MRDMRSGSTQYANGSIRAFLAKGRSRESGVAITILACSLRSLTTPASSTLVAPARNTDLGNTKLYGEKSKKRVERLMRIVKLATRRAPEPSDNALDHLSRGPGKTRLVPRSIINTNRRGAAVRDKLLVFGIRKVLSQCQNQWHAAALYGEHYAEELHPLEGNDRPLRNTGL